jgi:hypothetical protein
MKRNTKLAIGAGVGLLALGGVALLMAGGSSSTTPAKTGTGKPGMGAPGSFYVQQGHTYNLTLSTSWDWQQALSALSMAGWQITSPENAPIQAKWLGASTTINLAMPACQASADPNQPWNWPCGVTITAISDVAGAPPPAPLPGQGPAPKPAPMPGQYRPRVFTTSAIKSWMVR